MAGAAGEGGPIKAEKQNAKDVAEKEVQHERRVETIWTLI